MKVAVIDIGAGELALSVATSGAGEPIAVLGEFSLETALAADFAETGRERAIAGLKSFRHIIRQQNGVERVRAVASSALPEGAARQEFFREVQGLLDAPVELLAPGDEAALSWLASHDAAPVPEGGVAVTAEIDGAATHLAVGDGERLLDVFTLNLGSVGLARRFLDPAGYQPEHVLALSEHLNAHLNVESVSALAAGRPMGLVASGGTTAQLVSFLSRAQPERGRTHGAVIELDTVLAAFEELMHEGPATGLPPARAGALAASVGILMFLMDKLSLSEVTVSDMSLRHGCLREMLGLEKSFL